MILIKINPDFMSWRDKSRQLLSKKIHYEQIEWVCHEDGFHFGEYWEDVDVINTPLVPRDFVDLAFTVSAFRDDSTWSLLYRALYRIIYEDKNLLRNPLDADVMELMSRARQISRDMHKMKAFVRFKEIKTEEGSIFAAWHRPDHRIVRLCAPFFKDRFSGMKWVIMTEDETVSWDGEKLTFSEGVGEEDANLHDEKEDLWKTYYKAIFNPARIKISAMKRELPVRHWKTLPETELITGLIKEAPDRLEKFYESQRSLPAGNFTSIRELNAALLKCQACGICEKATAPVPGEGPHDAKIIIIGEQPGHEEDLAGKPFTGPSGKILNDALKLNGLNRDDFYITNAVKGFKFIPKGHTRLHKSADLSEITTCKSWLKKELHLLKPDVVVCLGRSAALSVIGKMVKIEDVRGKFFESAFSKKTIVLPHPASILRNNDDQQIAFQDFVDDWKKIY